MSLSALALLVILTGWLVMMPMASAQSGDEAKNPVVELKTSKGTIAIELYPDKTPITVKNFRDYVGKDFFDGLIFHRVIDGFMIQGGGFAPGMVEQKSGLMAPIQNESATGISNERGTIAMARTNDPNSATSQFFINLVDNDRLDTFGGGYTAFGRVIEGMDVVDAIAKVPTTTKRDNRGQPHQNVPIEPVVIESASLRSGS